MPPADDHPSASLGGNPQHYPVVVAPGLEGPVQIVRHLGPHPVLLRRHDSGGGHRPPRRVPDAEQTPSRARLPRQSHTFPRPPPAIGLGRPLRQAVVPQGLQQEGHGPSHQLGKAPGHPDGSLGAGDRGVAGPTQVGI